MSEFRIVADYPYPVAKVWRALTDPALVARWTTTGQGGRPEAFAPTVGTRFRFVAKPTIGWRGIVDCEVLEVDAPRLLRYSWRGDENGARTWLAQAAAAPREADWSDLDPEGPAFLYDDSDWARLVYVFGDGGQLIHPRMERGATDALGPVLALPTAALTAPKADNTTPAEAVIVEEMR